MNNSMKIGLGIDTGGTYTDAVIYDFDRKNILHSDKSITVKEDLTIGINNILNNIPEKFKKQISIVSLSTTLATNACVEGKGSRAALVLIGCDKNVMAKYGHKYGLTDIDNFIFLEGGHTQHGEPGQEPNWEILKTEIQKISPCTDSYGVIELWGIHNNSYELKAKSLIRELTGAPVVCAHELTNEINSLKRAASTLLNAQLIFLINEFINAIKESLKNHKIDAPLVIVRGDGSLMSEEFARERPVETLLSGPASSVWGGTALSGLNNCIIVDMGGTTSDIAIVNNGLPSLAHTGVKVGDWTTGTKSVKISTLGLGGDSSISFDREGNIVLESVRSAPLCWLASRWPGVLDKMKEMAESKKRHTRSLCEFYYLMKDISEDSYYTPQEKAIAAALKNGPLSISDLCAAADTSIYSIKLDRLVKNTIIMRSALTPTDIMHLTNQFTGWSKDAAAYGADILAFNLGITQDELIDKVNFIIKEKLYQSIVSFLLENDDVLKDKLSPQAKDMIYAGFRFYNDKKSGNASFPSVYINFSTPYPLVGIGAPIHHYLPDVAQALNTECVIPSHAAVANAMGAITGNVSAEAEVFIRPVFGDAGVSGYTVYTEEQPKNFSDYTFALQWATSEAERIARNKAFKHGAANVNVLTDVFKKEAYLAVSLVDATSGSAEDQPSESNKLIVETLVRARAIGCLNI